MKLGSWLKTLWHSIRSPAKTLSLGTLTLGGFVAGVVFWGGFNTALEATNRLEFCVGCHEMKDYVYQELQGTVHDTNRSGVRAGCPDCHVPHEWTDKIARKMQASKEVWGWLFGTINTPEKFEGHRKVMAQREWARLKANDSLECRNCHTELAMDITAQKPRAARVHQEWLFTDRATCIDCHKGIAHRLPDMTGVPPGWADPDLPSPGHPLGPEERTDG
ncbi:MAG: NapC/NirT family cytochrome c [Caenispirillum bisanense]|nr:NapC/NirT family cytochrome c [Caenispirillum bisanense]MCA1972470.1 NapC/NirT family cytochrome c [Caenispirillum sp.]